MKIPLPKNYNYEKTLEELDEEQLKAKIMIDIFKEIKKRQEEHPNKCPWCNN
ncbi:hypothetical protein K8R33_04505 [archaeon]|nr:hypothetical protein [archaeon]